MTIQLRDLPYSRDALAPAMSAETMNFHWGKHHRGYVDTVNRLVEKAGLESATLEEVLHKASGPLLNAAAQAWNHEFFWHSMSPRSGKPSPALSEAVQASFGSTAGLFKKLKTEGLALFGSGWVWLVRSADGALDVIATPNAGLRIHDEDMVPLLVCDVWEHAYYIDHRNDRGRYLDGFCELVDWSSISDRLALAQSSQTKGRMS